MFFFNLINLMNFFYLYLHELRFRLFYTLFGFLFNVVIFCFEIQPIFFHFFKSIQASVIIVSDLFEFWYTMMVVSFTFSFFLSFSFFLYNLWAFLSPGFYRKESQFFFILFLWNSLLSILSIFLVVFILGPILVKYIFYGFQNSTFIDISCLPRLSSFAIAIIKILFCFFFLIQLLSSFWISIEYAIISPYVFVEFRKYAYVIIIFLAAFLAPPDLLTQLSISFIFVFIYEILAFLSLWYQIYAERLVFKVKR